MTKTSKYEFQQLHPCLARGTKDPEEILKGKWSGWSAEEKFDGDRRIGQFVEVLGNPMVRFTGRRVSDKDGLLVEKTANVPHLSGITALATVPPEFFTEAKPPPKSLMGTVLDGEFVCSWQGARSKDVTSIMGSLPEKAIAKQRERGFIYWMVFDCLFFKGEDIRKSPLLTRRDALNEAVHEWHNKHVIPVMSYMGSDMEEFLQRVWKRGGEGIILKENYKPYGDEKSWVKVKKVFTEDVVIMGYDDAKEVSEKVSGEVSATKYAKLGWIGAVRFGQYKAGKLTYCGSCSGMTDALRKELSENGKKHLGRVVEIMANEREPTGAFRHPRWIGWRDDKNPKDCQWQAGK